MDIIKRLTIISVIVLSVFFNYFSIAYCENPAPLVLDLDTCVNTALQKNPNIINLKSKIGEAQGQYMQAKSSLLPKINITGNYIANNPEVSFNLPGMPDKVSVTPASNYNAGVGLAFLLSTFGKVEHAVAASFLNIRVAEVNYDAGINDLIFNVRKAYCDYKELEGLQQVAKDTLKSSDKHLKQAEILFNVGTIPKFDVIRFETFQAQAEQNYVTSQKYSSLAKVKLLNVIGIDINTETEIPDIEEEFLDYVIIDKKEMQKLAIENRSEIIMMKTSIKIGEELLTAARLGHNPDLILTSRYTNQTMTAFGPANSLQTVLSLNIPFIDSGNTKGKIKEATEVLNQLNTSYYDLEQKIFMEVEDAYLSLIEEKTNYLTAKKSLEYAKEALRIAEIRFDEGIATSLELQDTQLSYQRACADLINAKYRYFTAIAKQEKAIARKPENIGGANNEK